MEQISYKNARSLIQTLDVLSFSGKGTFSFLIKAGTAISLEIPDIEIPTHSAIAWNEHGRLLKIESWDGEGVRDKPLSHRLPFYWLPIPRELITINEEFAQKIFSKKDQKYATLLDLIKAFLNIPIKRDNRWQCAEFVNWALSEAGLKLPRNAETPVDVVNEIYKLNGGEIVYVTK